MVLEGGETTDVNREMTRSRAIIPNGSVSPRLTKLASRGTKQERMPFPAPFLSATSKSKHYHLMTIE